MDLLHKRYASPFCLLDSLIQAGQFSEYVLFLLGRAAAERDEKMMWEFFLHRVYDKSFNAWKQEITSEPMQNGVMDEAAKKDIIARSNMILNGFVPEN